MAWKRRCGESARRAWTIALCVVTSIVVAEVGLGWRIEAGEQARRVFFVESFSPTLPAALRTVDGLKGRLQEKSSERIELFFDALELNRIPGEAQQERTARFLGDKYAELPPDVVIARGQWALQFLLKYHQIIEPHIPIIYCCTPAFAVRRMNLPREIVGVTRELDWSKTLELAAHLQPNARNVVIISGASQFDKEWEEDTLQKLQPHLGRYHTRKLSGLPFDQLVNEVSLLTRDTIGLLLTVLVDGSGERRVPAEVSAALAKASGAPLYSVFDTFIGEGVVGGYTDSSEAQGVAAADLVLEILAGQRPATLPTQVKPEPGYKVDARQLERWRFSFSDLPPDTEVKFKVPGRWEQYRAFVVIVSGGFGLMCAISGALLFQISRRKRAEVSLRQSEERLTFTAASTNTGLWEYDVPTGHLWTTEQSRALFGLDPNSVSKPKAFLRAVHPDDRPIVTAAIRAARAGGPDLKISEFRIRGTNGQTRWILASSKTHLAKDGKPFIVSGMLRDITPRKTAERQAEQLSERLSTIQDEERQQIAQDLHDSTAQHLAAVSMNMMSLQNRLAEDPIARELCHEIECSLGDASKELRTYTYLLHPPQLEKDGLRRSVHRYGEGFARRTGLTIKLRTSPQVDSLPLSDQRALLRVLQEALANVHRHASASKVSIALKCSAGWVHLIISDDGKGINGVFHTRRAGVGIPGMTARLRRLGGDLEIQSGTKGTTLHGILPWRENAM